MHPIRLPVVALALLALLAGVPAAHAKKPPPPPANGFPVCTAAGNQDQHSITGDGGNGFYVAWLDDRNSATGTYQDIYLQHVLIDGTIAPGWPATGLALTALGYNSRPFVHADGAGGALVVWEPANEIRAQRVDASGAIHSGWPASGKAIVTGYHYGPFASTGDGHGGCFIGWVTTFNGSQQIATLTRIDADGNPVAPWTAAGSVLGSDELIRFLALGSDAPDAVVYAFGTYFNGQVDQVHARVGRIAGDASVGMSSSLYYGQRNWDASAIGDGQGGVFTAFTSQTLMPPSSGSWAQHVDAAGAKAWPDSLAVPAGTVLAFDGGTGAYLLGFEGATLVARRRGADGALAPGWTPGGLALASPGNRGHMGALRTANGFFACWAESAAGLDLRALAVMSNGALVPGWPAGGVPVTQAAGDQSGFSLLPADSGEVFVVWSDDRGGPGNRDIYASRIGVLPPVGVVPSPMGGAAITFRAVAPNPARDLVRVDLALAPGARATLELIDVNGRVRARRAVSASSTFALGDLPPGLYWLRATHDGTTASARLAVVH